MPHSTTIIEISMGLWATLNNAHLQDRRIRFARGGVSAIGRVVGFDRRGGIQHVTIESDGLVEVRFIVAGGEAEFV